MTSKSSQKVNHQPQTKSPIGTLSHYLNVGRSVGQFMRDQLNLVTGVPIQTLDNLGNLLNGLDRLSRPSIPKSQSPNNVGRLVEDFVRDQSRLVIGVPIQTLDNLGNLLNELDRLSRPSIPKSQSPNNPTLPFPKGSPQNPEIEI